MNKYGRQVCISALKISNLNTLGIKIGDRVAVKLGYEPDEDKRYATPKEITSEVMEIDSKGRWFRIVSDKGFNRCCLFASTYDNGRKFGYRILRKEMRL